MKKLTVMAIVLGIAITSGLIFFQISSVCYPKRVEIEYDLKDLQAGSMEYSNCLDLKNKIEIFNQKCDPDFEKIIC